MGLPMYRFVNQGESELAAIERLGTENLRLKAEIERLEEENKQLRVQHDRDQALIDRLHYSLAHGLI